jgi:hypothetical protein
MSAQAIYDRVPLGSLVRYSDGTPRPPERFKKKLSAWENNNNGGRLVRKSAPHTVGAHTTPASIILHQGDFGGAGIVVLKVFKTFSVNSPLTFTVIERPKPAMVRVLNRACSMRSPPMRARRIRLKGGRHEHASTRPSRRRPHPCLGGGFVCPHP